MSVELKADSIPTDHKDVIHDVKYDHYKIRMATCSSDQTVKVFDKLERGKWQITSSWKAHSGSVWRLDWSNPEFGQVIATCSFDRTASVWEEILGEKCSPAMTPSRRWLRRTTLVDSRTSVTDVQFAPKYLGLQLATVSADGTIRIYEAPDIMNISQWTLQHEIPTKVPLCCLSWNKSAFRVPHLLAVGSDQAGTALAKILIYGYAENTRKWSQLTAIDEITEPVTDIAFAPNNGRSFHVLAVASKDLYILHIRGLTDSLGNFQLDVQSAKFPDHNCPVRRVCWNILATMLVSTGDDGCLRTWRMNYQKTWNCVSVLKPEDFPQKSLPPSPQFQTNSSTTKFFWKGPISDPAPWH